MNFTPYLEGHYNPVLDEATAHGSWISALGNRSPRSSARNERAS